MTARVVLYDACVLYPAAVRDLLIGLAQKPQLCRARWTAEIHDEWTRNVLAKRPDLRAEQLARTRQLMDAAVPDCLVTGYETLIPSLHLPDPDDRHVLAAAVHCGANVIVTFNRKDFPPEALTPYELEVRSPDAFVLHLLELHPALVYRTLKERRTALRNPPKSPAAYLDTLQLQGLSQTVLHLRDAIDLI